MEEESIAVEVDTDGEFAVEYDVESDNSPLTESDISSVKSGEVGFLLQFADKNNVIPLSIGLCRAVQIV